MHLVARFICVLVSYCLSISFAQAFTETSPLNTAIDSNQISVSGVSSGGYMAVQLHVAYSDIFMGVGAIAGGPYFCAENRPPSDINTIKTICMVGLGADLTASKYIAAAKEAAQEGKVSSLNNLKDDKVYIFNSQNDQVINPALGFITKVFYEEFVETPASQIEARSYITKFGPFYPVAHGMPTDVRSFDDYQNFEKYMTPCSPSNSQQYPWFPNQFLRGNDPWIYNCDAFLLGGYNLAADILGHIYGAMERPEQADMSRMFAFNQLDYIDDSSITTVTQLNGAGLDEEGYVYVPEGCMGSAKACRLHVALHGCQMFPKWTFIGKTGSAFAGQELTFGGLYRENIYNTVAEANDIIIVYPQAHNIGTKEEDPNPYGCWEFWAFEDDNIDTYYTREGREMKLIANVVEALVAGSLEVRSQALVVRR